MDKEGGDDSPQKRKLPLNQPEKCLVLLGWNVAVTTRLDGKQHSQQREREKDKEA